MNKKLLLIAIAIFAADMSIEAGRGGRGGGRGAGHGGASRGGSAGRGGAGHAGSGSRSGSHSSSSSSSHTNNFNGGGYGYGGAVGAGILTGAVVGTTVGLAASSGGKNNAQQPNPVDQAQAEQIRYNTQRQREQDSAANNDRSQQIQDLKQRIAALEMQ